MAAENPGASPLAAAPRPKDSDYDVLCMGRSSIDLYAHQIGVPITEVRSFDAYVGGCPTNVSVGTRRLGLKSALLTGVGTDQVGDFVLHFLEREGVATHFVPRFADRRTSAVIMAIQPPDSFPLTFYRENCADTGLSVEHVHRAPVARSRLLFLSGTGLSVEPSRTATMLAAEIARDAGVTTLLDLDYRAVVWPSAEAFGVHVRALARTCTLAVGTEEELQAATGESDAGRGVRRLSAGGLELFVLKRGAAGCRVYRREGDVVDVPAFKIKVLNVLGAGDAFASGFIYGYLQGWRPEKAARFANAVGAIVVTRHGCANFMPRMDEVLAFMTEHGESAVADYT
jgi:5-dehydro-2-deoxygluconokinase